jgi:2-polyprenyl-6-methoxyphenol hydroxylase-like FAD-dependent oxidoreductase
MRVAISGAGVAGPTLAFWLLRAGHEPVLVETAPQLRTGGYMIDFWGVGYTVAERMGILPLVRDAGYEIEEVRYLDGRGRRAGAISARTISRSLGDRFTSLPRGELSAIIYQALQGRVETLFATTIEAFEEHGSGVRLGLSNNVERDFDILVGADGLHSNVRRLAFGPQERFETPLGYYVAAFECTGYRPREEGAYVSCGVAGRQISRIALRDDRTTFLFVFASERLPGEEPSTLDQRKHVLERVFAGMDWEWPKIREELNRAEDVYFDRVSQIVMRGWTRGRVALLGDAAACVSLVAGEGIGLGMTEAYVLAGELAASVGYVPAFSRFQRRLRRFISGKQKSARSFAASFTPKTALGVRLRNAAVRLMAVPGLPDFFVGPMMRDDFKLPDYRL